MKKIQATLTFCLLFISSSIGAKKPLSLRVNTPLLCVATPNVVSSDTSPDYNPNESARLSGCEEALNNYTQQLEKLGQSPLGNRERNHIDLIILDAKQMQETVSPISPEMGKRFEELISSAKELSIQ
jgi:hypothetical protein